MSRHDVFISYRREGGAEIARLLRIALSQHGYRVFIDVDDLSSGQFDERLLQSIADTPNFVLILSPGVLARAQDPRDWVRLELEQALRTHRNVVPVLMPGFEYPDVEDLPSELRGLQRHNAVRYSHQYFDATVQRLVQYLPLADDPDHNPATNPTLLPDRAAYPEPLDSNEYGAFVPISITPYLVLGLLTAWAYVAQVFGSTLAAHIAGRRDYFVDHVHSAGLITDKTQHTAFEALADRAFKIDARLPRRFALGLSIAGVYTAGLFLYHLALQDVSVMTVLPILLLALASGLFYVLITAFVLWSHSTLKNHDRYERLLYRWLSDPRVSPNTLPDSGFSQRWEFLDKHVALFLIVGLPVVFSPAIGGWYVLITGAVPVGTLMVPLWVLVIAGAYHLWGVRLLRRLYHDHLAAEQIQ